MRTAAKTPGKTGSKSTSKRTVTKTGRQAKGQASKKDVAASYNAYKFFNGKQYTGMAVGRSEHWNYDPGVWTDKKITPEKWLINFEVVKRRKGHAPEGSGVPVGTEYHWYILAHQVVKKLDANSYTTVMNGIKLKLAHKRASSDKWNISDQTQRNHLIKLLKEYITELEAMDVTDFMESEKDQTLSKTAKKAAERLKKVKPPVKKQRIAELA